MGSKKQQAQRVRFVIIPPKGSSEIGMREAYDHTMRRLRRRYRLTAKTRRGLNRVIDHGWDMYQDQGGAIAEEMDAALVWLELQVKRTPRKRRSRTTMMAEGGA